MPDTGFNTLETPRLRLRRFRLDDAPVFQAYRDDPDVARYQSWDTPFSLDDATAFIKDIMGTHPDTPGDWYQFAVARDPGDRLIGDVALYTSMDVPDETEIGYSLATVEAGRGLATEAVGALLDYALETRGHGYVRAWADTRNERSLALLARLRFERPDMAPRRSWFKGAWSEEICHLMTRERWRQRRDRNDA